MCVLVGDNHVYFYAMSQPIVDISIATNELNFSFYHSIVCKCLKGSCFKQREKKLSKIKGIYNKQYQRQKKSLIDNSYVDYFKYSYLSAHRTQEAKRLRTAYIIIWCNIQNRVYGWDTLGPNLLRFTCDRTFLLHSNDIRLIKDKFFPCYFEFFSLCINRNWRASSDNGKHWIWSANDGCHLNI